MNINKYTINSLLKLTLISSIVLSTVHSILVNAAEESPCVLKSEEPLNSDLKQESKDFEKKIYECLGQINSSIKENQSSLIQALDNTEKNNKFDKLLSKNDSLIYINLPIAAILLLLWFLNQQKQQRQIEQITKNQNKIIAKFNEFNEINNKLSTLNKTNNQIVEKIQDSEQKNIDSEIRLREFISKQQFNQSRDYHYGSTLDTSHFASVAVVDELTQLIEKYNRDKNYFYSQAIDTVAETKESIEQRRSGNSNTVILEHTNQKKYWIIEEDNQYYLIPHANIKIEEHNIKTLEYLFDCTNFTAEYSNFELIKPAKVSKQPSDTWQIEEKGKLNFN